MLNREGCKLSSPLGPKYDADSQYLEIHVREAVAVTERAHNPQNCFFSPVPYGELGPVRVPVLGDVSNSTARRGLDLKLKSQDGIRGVIKIVSK